MEVKQKICIDCGPPSETRFAKNTGTINAVAMRVKTVNFTQNMLFPTYDHVNVGRVEGIDQQRWRRTRGRP